MKIPSPLLLLLAVTPLLGEQVTVREAVVLKADRNVVSIKPGTLVDLVSRDGDTVTVSYHNVTGPLPAAKVGAASEAAALAKAGEAKPAVAPAPAKPPQSIAGKAVQKARDAADAHKKNEVQPANQVVP